MKKSNHRKRYLSPYLMKKIFDDDDEDEENIPTIKTTNIINQKTISSTAMLKLIKPKLKKFFTKIVDDNDVSEMEKMILVDLLPFFLTYHKNTISPDMELINIVPLLILFCDPVYQSVNNTQYENEIWYKNRGKIDLFRELQQIKNYITIDFSDKVQLPLFYTKGAYPATLSGDERFNLIVPLVQNFKTQLSSISDGYKKKLFSKYIVNKRMKSKSKRKVSKRKISRRKKSKSKRKISRRNKSKSKRKVSRRNKSKSKRKVSKRMKSKSKRKVSRRK